MKNKKYTNDEIIKAATIMKDWFTKLANITTEERNAKRYNEARLEMVNVITALETYNQLQQVK